VWRLYESKWMCERPSRLEDGTILARLLEELPEGHLLADDDWHDHDLPLGYQRR